MSNEIDFAALLADPEAAAQLPKELREYATRQEAKARATEEENSKLRTQLRQTEVKDFLKSKNLPEGLAGNVGDSNPQEWYDQYGKFFATATAGEGENPPTGEESAGETGGTPVPPPAQGAGNGAPPANPGAALTPEQLQALAGITGQVPQAAPAGGAPVGDQITEATKGATSTEDFLNRLRSVDGAIV